MNIRFLAPMLLALPLAAGDPWTKADTARESIAVAFSAADWSQTLNLQKCGFRELNPILGERPSRASVNAYFIASIGLHVLIAKLLPSKYRHAFQYITIGWEAGFVTHNAHIGVRFTF